MNRISAFMLRLCMLLCIAYCTSVQAQTVTPPYPSATYTSRAAAWHACEADIPASIEYMSSAYPSPDSVVRQYCTEFPMPDNNLFMEVIPQQVYFMPALNIYQNSGYSSPGGMPVYADYYVTFVCSDQSLRFPHEFIVAHTSDRPPMLAILAVASATAIFA
ncbi:hypothetical protein, partial [Dyella choica]